MTTMDAIAALDLDAIKVKLMHKESGEGWSLDKANATEIEYKRFLIMQKLYPQESIAPLFDVDIFWHYHILDTLKYADDCQAVFGHFLHHFPYLGLRGEDDELAHAAQGSRARELYQLTFGSDYPPADDAQARDDHAATLLQGAWSATLPLAAGASAPLGAWSATLPLKNATAAPLGAWSATLPLRPAQAGAWSAASPRAGNPPTIGYNLNRPGLSLAS